MSYDILVLLPSAYSKKPKKASNTNEHGELIAALERKFNAWNLKYILDSKAGAAYKLKFYQLETAFFSKSHLILYIVDLSSEESFRSCITRLVDTCQDRIQMTRIIVMSLDKHNFEDLCETEIDLMFLGNCAWKSDDDIQWKALELKLQEKLQFIEINNNSLHCMKSLTAPIQISQHTSQFKIKSFFHSLPSKFDIEKKKYFKTKPSSDEFKASVPNIKISDPTEECFRTEAEKKEIELRPKQNHSKLSLNSLFRKRSRKGRDSGLSIGSSVSNGSDSKNSMSLGVDMNKNEKIGFLSTSCGNSPSCERSFELRTSSFEKTKQYKAKIQIFKEKANRAFQSANCLQSPENKRRKQIEPLFINEVQFSDNQITQFSDILINNLEPELKSYNNILSGTERGHSEPPSANGEFITDVPVNGKIKYYSWNSDLSKSQERILSELTHHDEEMISPIFQHIEHEERYPETTDFDLLEDPINCVESSDDLFDDDITLPVCSNDNVDINDDEIDDKYFKVQYAPNTQHSPMKAEKHSVSFKIEGMDSLENIMESIEKSCNDMKIKFKEGNNTVLLNTFKSKANTNTQSKVEVTDIINESKISRLETLEEADYESGNVVKTGNRNVIDECKPILKSVHSPNNLSAPIAPTRTESASNSGQSYLYNTTKSMIENPLVVMGIFTATALTAPMWSAYIPHHANIGSMLYDAASDVLNNEMIKSVPQKIISTTSLGAAATVNSLKRFITGTINNNFFF